MLVPRSAEQRYLSACRVDDASVLKSVPSLCQSPYSGDQSNRLTPAPVYPDAVWRGLFSSRFDTLLWCSPKKPLSGQGMAGSETSFVIGAQL